MARAMSLSSLCLRCCWRLGIIQQRLQAGLLRLLVGGAQRLVVEQQQAGHIAVRSLHDLLGRRQSRAGFVQTIAHRMARVRIFPGCKGLRGKSPLHQRLSLLA